MLGFWIRASPLSGTLLFWVFSFKHHPSGSEQQPTYFLEERGWPGNLKVGERGELTPDATQNCPLLVSLPPHPPRVQARSYLCPPHKRKAIKHRWTQAMFSESSGKMHCVLALPHQPSHFFLLSFFFVLSLFCFSSFFNFWFSFYSSLLAHISLAAFKSLVYKMRCWVNENEEGSPSLPVHSKLGLFCLLRDTSQRIRQGLALELTAFEGNS